MNSLRISRISSLAEFAALKHKWNALVECSSSDSPFLRHEWFSYWWSYLETKGERPLVYVAHKGDELIAGCPFVQSIVKGSSKLRSLTTSHSPHFDIISSRDAAEGAIALIDSCLQRQCSHDIVELHNIPIDSPTIQHLTRTSRKWHWYYYRTMTSPFIETDGGWEDYLHDMKGRFRRNLRNREKRLRKLGAVTLEVISSSRELESALDESMTIEAAGWKGEQKSAIKSDRALVQCYRELLSDFCKNNYFQLYFLVVDGRRIAFDYVIQYKRQHYLLKTGFLPDFSIYAPGQLLQMRATERAFTQQQSRYEFLGETMPWKREWTPLARDHVSIYIFRRGISPSFKYLVKFGWKKQLKTIVGTVSPSLSNRLFDIPLHNSTSQVRL